MIIYTETINDGLMLLKRPLQFSLPTLVNRHKQADAPRASQTNLRIASFDNSIPGYTDRLLPGKYGSGNAQ